MSRFFYFNTPTGRGTVRQLILQSKKKILEQHMRTYINLAAANTKFETANQELKDAEQLLQIALKVQKSAIEKQKKSFQKSQYCASLHRQEMEKK